jgi:hypothetical protein
VVGGAFSTNEEEKYLRTFVRNVEGKESTFKI